MRDSVQEDERQNWNRRYQEESHGTFEPDPFLLNAYDGCFLNAGCLWCT